jgi:hypothetical protein
MGPSRDYEELVEGGEARRKASRLSPISTEAQHLQDRLEPAGGKAP